MVMWQHVSPFVLVYLRCVLILICTFSVTTWLFGGEGGGGGNLHVTKQFHYLFQCSSASFRVLPCSFFPFGATFHHLCLYSLLPHSVTLLAEYGTLVQRNSICRRLILHLNKSQVEGIKKDFSQPESVSSCCKSHTIDSSILDGLFFFFWLNICSLSPSTLTLWY